MDEGRAFQQDLRDLLTYIAPTEADPQMKQNLHHFQTLFSSLPEKQVCELNPYSFHK